MTTVDIAGPMLRSRLGVPEWHERGRCREVDPELFFPQDGGHTEAPKRICNGTGTGGDEGCEVRGECLNWAMSTGQRYGVIGGLSERERERLRRARRRAARVAAGGAA